jgi:hypothetical protein
MGIPIRTSQWFSAILLSAALVVWATPAVVAEEPKPRERSAKQLDRLIDAMASRNKEPKIVCTGRNEDVPVFADKYDWSEQARVARALESVVKDSSDELWWRLQDHFDDGRYCLTGESESSVEMSAENLSVGTFCHHIAVEKLGAPYLRHLAVDEERIHPQFAPQQVFWEHQKDWAGKPLYLIQIAVCQRAIEQMEKAVGTVSVGHGERESRGRDFTAEEKSTFAKQMKKEIEQLRQTKRAIVPEHIGLPGCDCAEFDAELAKRAKELLKEQRSRQNKSARNAAKPPG